MTTSDDLIEQYVSDVVQRLPRRQRDDVATELRTLLDEELADRMAADGSSPDQTATLALLARFGRPAEVAARYRPPLVLIDPADSRSFVRASSIGVAVIWALGLAAAFRRPIGSVGDGLTALQAFWFGAGLPALVWPGFLVVGYAGGAWARRRWPDRFAWRPRPQGHDRINRVGHGAALAFFVLGTAALVAPARMLDVLFDGRAAPAAYEAFVYDAAFLRLRGPVVLALLVLELAFLAVLIVRGRWEPTTRRLAIASTAIMSVVLAWVVVAGPIFVATPTDQFVKVVIVALVLVGLLDLYLSVRRERRRMMLSRLRPGL